MMRTLLKPWRCLRAWVTGYFWLPCPTCGKKFAGYEAGDGSKTARLGLHPISCKWCDR